MLVHERPADDDSGHTRDRTEHYCRQSDHRGEVPVDLANKRAAPREARKTDVSRYCPLAPPFFESYSTVLIDRDDACRILARSKERKTEREVLLIEGARMTLRPRAQTVTNYSGVTAFDTQQTRNKTNTLCVCVFLFLFHPLIVLGANDRNKEQEHADIIAC